jgi:alkylation response protein AidB-like acyl-CoA dehydrogenase
MIRDSETNQIPEGFIARMKEIGLVALTVPQEYGGLGVAMEVHCRKNASRCAQ